jgi:DNA repair protein RadA/Sms
MLVEFVNIHVTNPIHRMYVPFCQLGVFEMSECGLKAVQNPSEMFLTEHDSDSEILAGLAVAVVLDGSRTFAIEVQVLL